ncbi:MAG: phasin family protein [Rhodoplanes sp.]
MFDFAQEIVQAKDINELIELQTEFVQEQIRGPDRAVKGLGEKTAEAVTDKIAEAA